MSVTGFAEHLGAARHTIAKWSSLGADIQPRPDMQAALDTVLNRATAEEQERFHRLLADAGAGAGASAVGEAAFDVRIMAPTDLGDVDAGGEMRGWPAC